MYIIYAEKALEPGSNTSNSTLDLKLFYIYVFIYAFVMYLRIFHAFMNMPIVGTSGHFFSDVVKPHNSQLIQKRICKRTRFRLLVLFIWKFKLHLTEVIAL